MEDCNQSIHIKQEEAKNEIEFKSNTTLYVNHDRSKIEQVKLESVAVFDLPENPVTHIKTEDELKIEKSEPKIETRQDIEDYETDTMSNSDVVLGRLMMVHVKNQRQYEPTTEKTKTMKIEKGDDDEIKVKTEISDTDMDVVSGGYEDISISQLTEEFGIKNESDAFTFDIPERVKIEGIKYEYGETMDITKTVKIEGCDEEVKMETADLDIDEGAALTAEDPKNEERRYPSMIHSYPDAEKLNRRGVVNSRSSEHSLSVLNFESGAYSDFTSLDNVQGGSGSSDSLVCPLCRFMCQRPIMLDEHIIENHPHLIGSITRKMYECPNCSFKTVFSPKLTTHLLKNCESFSRSKSNQACTYCDARFTTKKSLDDHIIRKHPDFIASVSAKVHECTKCTYKTTAKNNLLRHMQQHPETFSSSRLSTCTHCSASFRASRSLQNHILKNHPDFAASVSSKLHQCAKCPFKNASKSHLVRHFRQCHDSEKRVKSISHTCSQCDFIYKKRISLDEHIINNHPDSIASIARKIYECPNCTYKTVFSAKLPAHLQRNCRATSRSKSDKACTHCDAMFKTKVSLDDHIIKNHPDFIESVSSKIHECAKCPYRTTFSGSLAKHMQKHPEAVSGDKLNTCIHCGATFHIKRKLDNHILRKHPDFISSIASKMHHCANCTYKTITKGDLVRHISNTHVSEKRKRSVNQNSYICSQCHATCKRQIMLDEHIIENHPDSIASITRKIYACSKCSYKTVYSARFAAHSLNNCEDTKSKRCVHCNARFKIKATLDDHIIRKHPEFMASVSAKVHECTHCTYRTTNTTNLVSHMRTHPETVSNNNCRTCEHCNASFRTNRSLGEHILRKHPNFSASVSSKTHECIKCTYKTTMKDRLDTHMLKQHPDSIQNISLKMHECAHCPYKTTAKNAFDRHIQTHPESVSNPKLNTCMDCNAVFRDRKPLYEHILRNHPESVGSISYKVHECTSCTYKTTIKKLFYNHILRKHSNLSTTDFSKKYECTNCTYKTAFKDCFDQHMFKNHPDSFSGASAKIYECTNCTYKTSVKRQFDNHVLRNHPDLFEKDSSKIKECIYCTFKTTVQSSFNRHMRTHPENASSFEDSTCIHCNATFRSKEILDNHILNKHPDFMSSVTSTILECANCTYKTTNKKLLDNHLLRKHSDSVTNVSSKIHECAHCTFKTAIKNFLVRHMQKHPETFSSSKLSKCVHCSATFEAKKTLDNHVLKKHPDFALSVSSKIYECTNCVYNTTFKIHFDEHTLKNHPDSIASITSKIHECPKCTYRTTMRTRMDKHISRKHPGTV